MSTIWNFTNFPTIQPNTAVSLYLNYSYQFILNLWFIKGYSEKRLLGSSATEILKGQPCLEKQVSCNKQLTYVW